MKKIYLARDYIEAERIQEFLQERGVEVYLSDVFTHSLQAANPMAFPAVWVGEGEHGDYIRRMIDGFLAQEYASTAGTASCQCPACGEVNPPGFELCWQCGAVLPEAGSG